MTQTTGNLRVRRTQKLLREALVELIEERNFESLTIGEITERAMVSRAAFYRNYQDKYDLVEQIFEEAMSALLKVVGELSAGPPPEVWGKFFEHIAEYERLYRALLGQKGSPWFARKMRASLAAMVVSAHTHEAHGQAKGERPTFTFSDDFIPDLVSTMFVEAITWWLEHDQPCTPHEMAERCARLASAMFKEVSTWE